MKKSIVIVAGGSGTRMGSELPKQFIELVEKPILMHTLEAFHQLDESIQLILVLPKAQLGFWMELKKKHRFTVPHQIASGGATRFLSVANGLELVEGDLVGVHDGVRPFISPKVLSTCFEIAESFGAAVPAIPIVQSLRKMKGSENEAVNRDQYRAVQTPQCFQTSVLKNAFKSTDRTDFSDDASVVEANGAKIALVDGDEQNIKVTTPFDLELARLIIARRTSSN